MVNVQEGHGRVERRVKAMMWFLSISLESRHCLIIYFTLVYENSLKWKEKSRNKVTTNWVL